MHDTQLNDTPADILVVDDNLQNLRLLSELLSKQGHNIRPAINAEVALEAVKRCRPNLILLDIRLPDINGFELCARFKSDMETKDIPIIFISGLEVKGL